MQTAVPICSREVEPLQPKGINMHTFEAIAHIRRESLSRGEALRFLMERMGFSSIYAEEIVNVIFGRVEQPQDEPAPALSH